MLLLLPAVALSRLELPRADFPSLLPGSIHLASDPKVFEGLSFTKRLRIISGHLQLIQCLFEKCQSRVGACAFADHCFVVNMTDSLLRGNSATFGGACYFSQTNYSNFARVCFVNNSAEYMGAMYLDGVWESRSPFTNLSDANFSLCRADEWTGALRIDHGGGSVTSCVFAENAAHSAGAFFDFAWEPSRRFVALTAFLNNSAHERAAAYCAFHIMHRSQFTGCVFARNACETGANAIYVESVDALIDVVECKFDKKQPLEIGIRFSGSVVDVRNSSFAEKKVTLPATVEAPRISLANLKKKKN
jgi:hypothetical protein